MAATNGCTAANLEPRLRSFSSQWSASDSLSIAIKINPFDGRSNASQRAPEMGAHYVPHCSSTRFPHRKGSSFCFGA